VCKFDLILSVLFLVAFTIFLDNKAHRIIMHSIKNLMIAVLFSYISRHTIFL